MNLPPGTTSRAVSDSGRSATPDWLLNLRDELKDWAYAVHDGVIGAEWRFNGAAKRYADLTGETVTPEQAIKF